ncbi:MAG: hypothetical protein ACXWNK_02420 [Vulcanimicrobiaceae bacterium]
MPHPHGVIVDRTYNRTILIVEPTALIVRSVDERRASTAFERILAEERTALPAIALFVSCVVILGLLAWGATAGLIGLLDSL